MEQNQEALQEKHAAEDTEFNYDNTGWPRDFDIRIEKAEQREVLEKS